jgi:hypothetical protein
MQGDAERHQSVQQRPRDPVAGDGGVSGVTFTWRGTVSPPLIADWTKPDFDVTVAHPARVYDY